jgi:hypothetical protein
MTNRTETTDTWEEYQAEAAPYPFIPFNLQTPEQLRAERDYWRLRGSPKYVRVIDRWLAKTVPS